MAISLPFLLRTPKEPISSKLALAQSERSQCRTRNVPTVRTPTCVSFGIKDEEESGQFYLLNGNQAFALMMYFIMKNIEITKDSYIAKTIVTTELVDTMAENTGIECHNTLTGFKYIAELMAKLEGTKKFIAAGEKATVMVGDFVRDKDAVSACAFFAAMAAVAKADGFHVARYIDQHVS